MFLIYCIFPKQPAIPSAYGRTHVKIRVLHQSSLGCITNLLLMLMMPCSLPLYQMLCIFGGCGEAVISSSLNRSCSFSTYWWGSSRNTKKNNTAHCSCTDQLDEVQALPEVERLAGHSIPAELSSASNSRRTASLTPPEDVIPANPSQSHDSPFRMHVVVLTYIQLMVPFN